MLLKAAIIPSSGGTFLHCQPVRWDVAHDIHAFKHQEENQRGAIQDGRTLEHRLGKQLEQTKLPRRHCCLRGFDVELTWLDPQAGEAAETNIKQDAAGDLSEYLQPVVAESA